MKRNTTITIFKEDIVTLGYAGPVYTAKIEVSERNPRLHVEACSDDYVESEFEQFLRNVGRVVAREENK